MKTSWDIVKDGTTRGIDVNTKAVVFRTGIPPYDSSHSCTHAQFLGGHMQDHLIATFGYDVLVDVIAAMLSFQPLDQTGSEAALFRKAINRALDLAIANGELESLNLIIPAGSDINRKGFYGMTPLMDACSSSHPNKYAIMKMLLQHAADPNATDNGGDNLLMRVLSGSSGTRDQLETIAPLMLDHGLDFNARNGNGKAANPLYSLGWPHRRLNDCTGSWYLDWARCLQAGYRGSR
jgi:hypothetical protein